MISRWVRTWYGAILDPSLRFIARLGITANMLTVSSLLVVVLAGIFFASNKIILGAWILMLGGFLDGLDGPLARVRGIHSPFGGFLDSICDHCGDFAVYLGLLILYIRSDSHIEIILLFVAMFASVFGSHVRSRAGMVTIDTKSIGLFTRFERIFLLFICILLGKVIIALWGLAIFNSFSTLQRVIYTVSAHSKQEKLVQSRETL
jgi:phosphatidylglycerophosphate synthase